MSDFNQILQRIKLDSVMNYLNYGCTTDQAEETTEHRDCYQKRIDQSFETVFDELKHIFPSACRDDDDLYSALLQFSVDHQETYIEMGFLAGFRFCMELQQACRNLKIEDVRPFMKELAHSQDQTAEIELEDGSRFEIKCRQIE